MSYAASLKVFITFYPQIRYALPGLFHMWKPVLPPILESIFTQRFHAPTHRLSSAMLEPRSQWSGVLRARRVLTLVPGLEGDSLWWEEGRIRGVGSAAAMERTAPPWIPRWSFRMRWLRRAW